MKRNERISKSLLSWGARQEKAELEYLLKQPEFERYMKRLMISGSIMKSVFTGNSQTFYNSGRQDFATEIWTSIAIIDNEAAVKMLLPEKEEGLND